MPTEPALIEALAATPAFARVAREVIAELIAAATPLRLAGGAFLFRRGDPYGERVYLLVSGAMRMQRQEGAEIELVPGDFIGLANYLDGQPHAATAFALGACRLLEIPADALHRLEQSRPALFNLLNRIIAEKLRARGSDRSLQRGTLAQPVTRIMRSAVSACRPCATFREAYELMLERRLGGVMITDPDGTLRGMLTWFDIARAFVQGGLAPDDPLERLPLRPAVTLPPDAPIWQAEELQQRHNARYVIVVENGTPLGLVSQRDILQLLATQPTALSRRIAAAATLADLDGLQAEIVAAAADARETNHLPSAAVRYLSDTHLAIQRRVVELTLSALAAEGHGAPPVPFALLVTGSGGRREMLLRPDQDNALIIDDRQRPLRGGDLVWFERFANRVNQSLDRAGYPFCPGEIMARNPMYRRPLRNWLASIDRIAAQPTERAARWSNIFFDFTTLYGDDDLTQAMRQRVLQALAERPSLLHRMADDDAEGRPALGLFNQLLTSPSRRGARIDLKRNGLRIISNAARIFALAHGIAVLNTLDRLTALVRIGRLSDDFTASIREAHEELLGLLLDHQLAQARADDGCCDGLLDPETLSEQGRSALRMALRAAKRLQERLQRDYGTDLY